MKLYGRQWTQRELLAQVGRLEQIGGLRRFRWTEGPEEGVEEIQVRTGAGLTFLVSPSRGLDISLAEFGGVPLSWQSPNGDVHPAFFEPRGNAWLRTAVGGLLMTCGLTQVGNASEDSGQSLGLHGRAHHLVARQVAAEGIWREDEYEMAIRGILEETAIFSDHLQLTRNIQARLGENRIVIKDRVENVGFQSAPHMILYHFNFGFPLLSPDTQIEFPSTRIRPRDPGTSVEGFDRWEPPSLNLQEQVYYHEELRTDNGWATVRILNPRYPSLRSQETVPLALQLSWSAQFLNNLIEWKAPGAGIQALGIEPANCHVEGRAAERARGTLIMLEPGEARTYELEIRIGA